MAARQARPRPRPRPRSAASLDVASAFPSRTMRRGVIVTLRAGRSSQPNVTRASRKAPSEGVGGYAVSILAAAIAADDRQDLAGDVARTARRREKDESGRDF